MNEPADKLFLDLRDPNFADKIQPLMDALDGESPLPCALIGGAYLDKCLKGMLETIFVKSSFADKIMDQERGALGSLFSRARMLYLLGHIDRVTLDNILLVSQIRNDFAHSHEPLTFDSPDIADRCKKLTRRKPVRHFSDLDEAAKKRLKQDEAKPRSRFIFVVMSTVVELSIIAGRLPAQKNTTG
jgi:DNA-binding MltR family transcriptional regulator